MVVCARLDQSERLPRTHICCDALASLINLPEIKPGESSLPTTPSCASGDIFKSLLYQKESTVGVLRLSINNILSVLTLR